MPVQHSPTSNNNGGPRTQCDQVVYEAMVKACEIVVCGRCNTATTDVANNNHNHRVVRQSSCGSTYGKSLSQQQQQSAKQKGINSRFNLEIQEVPTVRQILSTWRQNLNLPLRLDVYYEHTNNEETQRDLLERWCLTYSPESTPTVSIRSVCKRIVCMLRSLHCLIRILPAHSDTILAGAGFVGYSIYTTDAPIDLPSPSFASRFLPGIRTGYGLLDVSILYDATLSMRSEPIPIIVEKDAQVIKNYHSPLMQPLQSDPVEKKRVMSGLSLVMMDEEQNIEHQEQGFQQIGPGMGQNEPIVEDNLLPWGSPATRAAFHLPPAYGADMCHSGCDYGHDDVQQFTTTEYLSEYPQNGTADRLSISPSPLMNTPPQATWAKPTRNGEIPLSIDDGTTSDTENVAPPFTNPTSLQPTPSRMTSQSAHENHDTTRSIGSSPHNPQSMDRSNEPQRRQTSSSSMLLPPVTSLDLLQRSPFTKKITAREDRADNVSIATPFILESFRDEILTSSIPRTISADARARSGSFGGGSSKNPLVSGFGNLAISGRYYSSGPLSISSSTGHQLHSTIDADDMPFAVDDDFPLIDSTSNPFVAKISRSLCGNSKAEASDGSLNGVSETASSLAVSSLHQRCAVEGKPRLKLFEIAHSVNLSSQNSVVDENSPNDDYETIKEQLSDFRSFSASLMVGSIHDSCSE